MNIEKTCADAIAVVERYLANDVPAYDMRNELYEAREAVDSAWDVIHRSRKSLRLPPLEKLHHCMCRAAWHACLAAKSDEIMLAEKYVEEYKELVK